MGFENGSYNSRQRAVWLGGFFTLTALCVLFRVFYIQIVDPDPWRSLAPAQYESRIRLAAKRGLIYDRHRNLMAMEIPGYSLAIDPSLVTDIHKTAEAVAAVMGDDPQKIDRLLQANAHKHYLQLKEKLTAEQQNQLQARDIPGIIFNPERERTYPFATLGRPLIGLTNANHEGIAGVERAFNSMLSGQDGWAILQKDGLNRNVHTVDYPIEPALNGRHVVLTMDYVLQTVVEEELRRGVEHCQARWGSAVLMHPVTGEVLAMASLAGPRLNDEHSDFQNNLHNRAIQDNYEPGSVFKVVTLAAAIQEDIITPQSLIYCENGNYIINGKSIRDDNRSFQWLTASQAMQVSSNIAFSKIAKKLGKQTLFRYVQDFGFGNRTSIGLPGEAAGFLRPYYQWDDFLTATTAFGQGFSCTTLQLACMTAAIANGGELLKPRIYQSVLDEQGKCLEISERKVIRRVISEETAAKIADIMELSVKDGTGKRASVPGLRIAGKTGTAQKSIPGVEGYAPGRYESSFVGFWPVQSPEYVLVITLDEPRYEMFSSHSAAPIFSKIAERISGMPRTPSIPEPVYDSTGSLFTMLNTETVTSSSAPWTGYDVQAASRYFVPNLVGLSVRQAMRQLGFCGIRANINGNGIVKQQNLKPGIRVQENMVCQMICE